MKSAVRLGCGVALMFLLSAGAAYACHVSGSVICDRTGLPLADVRVDFVSTEGDPFSESVITDINGQFTIALPLVLACYTASVVLEDQQTAVDPASGARSICITDVEPNYQLDDFVVDDPSCEFTSTAESTWGQLKSSYK